MSRIVSLKLSSGEELLGSIPTEYIENTFTLDLDSIRRLQVAGQQGGQIGLALVPWMMSAVDGIVSINKNMIVAIVQEDKLAKQLVDAYLQETSGIQLASPGSLKGL